MWPAEYGTVWNCYRTTALVIIVVVGGADGLLANSRHVAHCGYACGSTLR